MIGKTIKAITLMGGDTDIEYNTKGYRCIPDGSERGDSKKQVQN